MSNKRSIVSSFLATTGHSLAPRIYLLEHLGVQPPPELCGDPDVDISQPSLGPLALRVLLPLVPLNGSPAPTGFECG